MSRSLEASQNSALNQFRHASQGNQHDKLAEYLSLSNEKKKDFLSKNKQLNKSLTVGGFTVEKLKQISEKIENDAATHKRLLDESINNKNRHAMLNTALEIFGVHDIYNASTMSQLNKQEFELVDYEKIKVSMKVGRCLSSSIKISVTVSTLKPYYKKSESFDQDGQTILDHKWIDEIVNFTAKYGNLMAFRKSLLPNLTKIVENFYIEDTNVRVLSEDIWEFNF